MPEYAFKENHPWRGDAQAIGRELERLAGDHGGLSADLVVEHARDATSPMHVCFEWDDAKAAAEHRKNTARRLIRSIVVVQEPASEPASVFVSVREDSTGPRYMAASAVVDQAHLVRAARGHALSYLRSARSRLDEIRAIEQRAGIAIERIASAEEALA